MKYPKVKCQVCGKEVCSNWHKRHFNKYHQVKIAEIIEENQKLLGGVKIIEQAAA